MMDEKTLLETLSSKIIQKGYNYKIGQVYIKTAKAFISFHKNKDINKLGMKDIEEFMEDFQNRFKLNFKKREITFQALLFLYIQVLKKPLIDEYIQKSKSISNNKKKRYKQTVMVF